MIDRIVQEAVRLVLEPAYEAKFSEHSHGFRHNRGCHTAIAEAVQYIEEGYDWVVDIDLKDFFNKVSHQGLMNCLREDIGDIRITRLISRMLKVHTVMPNCIKSPFQLQELIYRGHKFVRYADDTLVLKLLGDIFYIAF